MLLLLVYILQGMIFPHLRFSITIPLLLPLVSTGTAVYQGRDAGGLVGLFAGIFCDISFNQPVGLFTVLLTIGGIFIGVLADTVMARGFATFMICCTIVLAVSAFAQMFPLLLFEGVPPAPLLMLALRQTLYSLLFAVPIWFFVRALGHRAEERVRS